MKKNNFDVYQFVTDKIISALETGVKPWVCPWENAAGMNVMPVSFTSRENYNGINILLLWSAAAENGFTSKYWLTYKQAVANGGQVRKGEKGTRIIYYSVMEKENAKGEEEKIPFIKSFVVFNLDQVDGIEDPNPIVFDNANDDFKSHDEADLFIKASGADITERGNKAFFRPSTDEIYVPPRDQFKNECDFYATTLHELTHWTGGKKRLDRSMVGEFGSKDYAFEELIAELGAAFCIATLGIVGDCQHESYIASWLKALKNDKKYIFKAASQASKAHKFLNDKYLLEKENYQSAA